MAKSEKLPRLAGQSKEKIRWFSPVGAVRTTEDDIVEVTIAGLVIGTFMKGDRAARNILLVTLAGNPELGTQKLAAAFGMSGERLRQLRLLAKEKGLAAVTEIGVPRRPPLDPRIVRRLEGLFDKGLDIPRAYAAIGKKVSRASVGRVYKRWKERQPVAPAQPAPEQQTLAFVAPVPPVKPAPRKREAGMSALRAVVTPMPTWGRGLDELLPRGGALVQHVGSWLLLGMLNEQGVYEAAARFAVGVENDELRVALDATACALAIGEGCVEGVRRLATPSGAALLRADRVPSVNWVRDVLHAYAPDGAVLLHLDCARQRLQRLPAERGGTERAFYVDNHLRRYTGKHTIRKGWRMQDKKAVPGVTDYYVHDEVGRPVMRLDSPGHASLPSVLRLIGDFLQRYLPAGQHVTLVFDRAASSPETLATLRDEGFGLITYEKRPYPLVSPELFQEHFEHRGESIAWYEAPRRNLGRRRGRVRRIALRMTDGAQVNVLAVSSAPGVEVAKLLLARWGHQENQLKHEVSRWSINQLDGRRVEMYPLHEIIPNPARRRLERELADSKDEEAHALRALAHMGGDDRRREKAERIAASAYTRQQQLEDARAITPTRAPVSATELASKLRRHTGQLKVLVDTLRLALASAETDLARDLAAHLPKPREAKRLLRNILLAPGRVSLRSRAIHVELHVAATPPERRALANLLRAVNRRRLTLPGARTVGPLRFSIPNW